MSDSRTLQTRGRPTRASGFTLVELLIVLGLVSMLIGFLWPIYGTTVQEAEVTEEMSNVRQLQLLIDVYCNQNDEKYPRAGDNVSICGKRWYSTMVDAGVAEPFERKESIDEYEGIVATAARYRLTWAAYYDWRRMIPGQTIYAPGPGGVGTWLPDLPSTQVRRTSLLSPAGKGMLRAPDVRVGAKLGPWCCLPDWRPNAPVAFGDGSVERARWTSLLGEHDELVMENGVGAPVSTTWRGIRGRDR
jgi:prepilin-type N-terminal cleavage/methylation domain-containing protein